MQLHLINYDVRQSAGGHAFLFHAINESFQDPLQIMSVLHSFHESDGRLRRLGLSCLYMSKWFQ